MIACGLSFCSLRIVLSETRGRARSLGLGKSPFLSSLNLCILLHSFLHAFSNMKAGAGKLQFGQPHLLRSLQQTMLNSMKITRKSHSAQFLVLNWMKTTGKSHSAQELVLNSIKVTILGERLPKRIRSTSCIAKNNSPSSLGRGKTGWNLERSTR